MSGATGRGEPGQTVESVVVVIARGEVNGVTYLGGGVGYYVGKERYETAEIRLQSMRCDARVVPGAGTNHI